MTERQHLQHSHDRMQQHMETILTHPVTELPTDIAAAVLAIRTELQIQGYALSNYARHESAASSQVEEWARRTRAEECIDEIPDDHYDQTVEVPPT